METVPRMIPLYEAQYAAIMRAWPWDEEQQLPLELMMHFEGSEHLLWTIQQIYYRLDGDRIFQLATAMLDGATKRTVAMRVLDWFRSHAEPGHHQRLQRLIETGIEHLSANDPYAWLYVFDRWTKLVERFLDRYDLVEKEPGLQERRTIAESFTHIAQELVPWSLLETAIAQRLQAPVKD